MIFMDKFENVISRQIKIPATAKVNRGDSKIYMCLSKLPDVKPWRTES